MTNLCQIWSSLCFVKTVHYVERANKHLNYIFFDYHKGLVCFRFQLLQIAIIFLVGNQVSNYLLPN